MRGQAITIPVPNSGYRTDQPPHLTPPDALVAGVNVYIGQDGLLHPRSGYSSLQGAANTIDARINGGYSFQDQNGNFQYVVNTDHDLFALTGTGMTWESCPYTWLNMPYAWDTIPQGFGWEAVTNSMYPLDGSDTDPSQFAVFFQGGIAWVVMVDNFSNPVAWNSDLAEYQPVNYSPYQILEISESGTTATIVLQQPMTNIVVGDTIVVSGNSQSDYNGTWIVTGVPTPSMLTFTANSSGIAIGTGGSLTDETTMVMPPARDIAVIDNRMVIVNTVENGTRYLHRVRWSAAGDFTRWPVLAYNDVLDAEDDPIVAIQPLGQNLADVCGQQSIFILSGQEGDDANAFATERLETADGFAGPASPAAIIRAEGLQYWVSYKGYIKSFDGVNVTPISPPIDFALQANFDCANASKCHAAEIISQRQIVFFFSSTTTAGSPEPYLNALVGAPATPPITSDPTQAAVYDLQRQIFLPFYQFSEGITASFDGQINDSMNWINCPYTWNTMPYTWENAPIALNTDTIIGTADGEVDSFFRGVADGDNLYPVPWGATWTYLYDPENIYKFQWAEFYFQPVAGAAMQPGGVEVVTMLFTTLTFPYDPGTPLVAFACSMAEGWQNQPTLPGPTNPNNVRNNLVKMSLSSSESKGGAGLAGGMLFGFKDARGQYGTG